MTLTIRQADEQDLAVMIAWAGREGWNPGDDDIKPFFEADRSGYWLAEVDGAVAACISLVHHQPSFAFLGFYIADPRFRGQGIGHRLWQDVIGRSSATTIGLDGVVAQQANYIKSGFAYAHANWRYGGVIAEGSVDLEAQPIPVGRMIDVIAYDARHNPSPRPRFISQWLTDTPTRQSACITRNGEIVALGTIRACLEGHKIGPLFSDDEETADRLFRHLVAKAGGGMIFLDVPEPNGPARQLCERYGMAPFFETARMYRGLAPELPLRNIFGITTFELG